MNAAPTTPVLANEAQRGSHWQQRMVGRHSWCVLHRADCLDVLPIKVDAVVTDPPYGIGKDAATRRPSNYQRQAGMLARDWDNEPADLCRPSYWQHWFAPLERAWTTGDATRAAYSLPAAKKLGSVLIWG